MLVFISVVSALWPYIWPQTNIFSFIIIILRHSRLCIIYQIRYIFHTIFFYINNNNNNEIDSDTHIHLHINYVREPNLTHVLDINTKLHLFPLTSQRSWKVDWKLDRRWCMLLAYFSAVLHCCSSSQSLEEEKVLREKCFPRRKSKIWNSPDSQHSEE